MKKKDIAIIVIAASGIALVLFGIPFAGWIARVVKANTPETPTTTTTETTVKASTPIVNTDKTYYCNEPLWSVLPTKVRSEDSTEEEFLKFTQDVAAAMGFNPDDAKIDNWDVGHFGCSDVQVFRSCDIPSEYEYDGTPLFLVSHEYLDGGDMDKDTRCTFFYSRDFKFMVVLNGSYVRSYWGELYTEDYIMEIYNQCEGFLAHGDVDFTPITIPGLYFGEPTMFDVTGDGVEDKVYGSMYGSGMVRTQLHVVDVATGELYILDGYNYDYYPEGVEDGRLIIIESGPNGYGDPIKKTQGTVVLQNGRLIFVADDNKIKEDTAAVFEGAEEIALTDDDFVFEYEGHTFSIDNDWHDYIDELGYPEEYDENNYGYITTYNTGYWWRMQYPSAGNHEWYFAVTLVSPSRVREGDDTVVDAISLNLTPTARGIKAGDSVETLAAVYGAPDRIEYFEDNAGMVFVIYKGKTGEIAFAVNNEGIIEYTCLFSI